MKIQMNSKIKSCIFSSIITAIFIVVIARPGMVHMLGYAIFLVIFGEGSNESIRFEKIFLYSFDAMLGLIVFTISFKILKKIFSN